MWVNIEKQNIFDTSNSLDLFVKSYAFMKECISKLLNVWFYLNFLKHEVPDTMINMG